jgi:hypothetical protein
MQRLGGTTMAQKPDRVDLLVNGVRKLTLKDSDEGSLNERAPYNGRATSAIIFGPTGSVATFYDDQKFREGENYVTIQKKVSGQVSVPLAKNFVSDSEAEGDKMYMAEADKYDFYFFRNRKLEWWEKVIKDIPGGELAFDIIKEIVEDSDDPRVKGAVKVVNAIVGKPNDENYRVDNCSSVKFGD